MHKNKNILFFLLVGISLLAAACQPAPQVDPGQVAVIVALTQTAAVLANPPAVTAAPTTAPATSAPAATQAPVATSAPTAAQAAGAYQPVSADECTSLKDDLAQSIAQNGEVTSPVGFEDYVNKKTGSGCQITFTVVGQDVITTPVTTALPILGWQEDTAYGAGGVGGYISAYRKDNVLCLFAAEVKAADPNACPSGQGYMACMSSLSQDQLKHTVTLNCARPNP